MKHLVIKIYTIALLIFSITIISTAQNTIDAWGGFVSLEPNGNTDADGWNLGDRYDGSTDNTSHFYTATNYIATGGSGFLILNNADSSADTTIYLNSITIGDDDPNNYQGPIVSGSVAGDLTFETRNNVRLQVDDNAATVFSITGAKDLTINGGTYDSTRRGNTAGSFAASFSGITGKTIINNATFLGPDVDQNWINTEGGSGLVINSSGEIVLDNVTSEGGFGKPRRRIVIDQFYGSLDTVDTSALGGGHGLIIQNSSASIFATNLSAKAGNAGGYAIEYTRAFDASYTATANGGHGINGGGTLNAQTANIAAGSGGSFTVDSLDGHAFDITFSANGGNGINGGTQSGILTNATVTAGNGGSINIDAVTSGAITFNADGGTALNGNLGDGSLSGLFIAGNGASEIYISSGSAEFNLSGGNAVNNSSDQQVIIANGRYLGGHGGDNIYLSATNSTQSEIISNGGIALSGTAIIKDGVFTGGNGGNINANTAVSSSIHANGGTAISLRYNNSTSTNNIINDGIFTGGNGGNITITNGIADARGGHAITSIMTSDGTTNGTINSGTLIINDGIFTGGNGGRATTTTGSTTAYEGSGAFLFGGTNIINGGTFSHGNKGTASSIINLQTDNALDVSNAHSLTIDSINEDKPLFKGSIAIADLDSVNLNSGNVIGDVRMAGSIDNLNVNSSFKINGTFEIGSLVGFSTNTVNVNIDSSNDGSVFENISMFDTSYLTFSNQTFTSANNANILVNELSQINFLNGANFSPGTSVNIGLGSFTSVGDITLDDATLNLSYNGIKNGSLAISSGALNLNGSNARLNLTGSPTNSSGSVNFGSLGNNSDVIDLSKINTDFGWLLDTTVNTQGNTSNALIVSFSYNLPTNHIAISNFQNTNHYDLVSDDIANNNFYIINAMGAVKGSELIRFMELDEVNTSDGVFKDNQQINNLISARNTEVRSRHGFASSNPKSQKPYGVSGPSVNKPEVQGWIRGYNTKGTYDQTASFNTHKIDGTGTILGLDKYNNNILTGLAIGQSSSKSYSASVYSSNSEIINGSIYSTIGGRDNFIDLAISYSEADTHIKSFFNIPSYKINSSLESYYLGVGHSFDAFKDIRVTPELSYLYSKYKQDGYTRPGIVEKNVSSFSSNSGILSTGINIATQYQIDWFNKGLAMIPEFRLHWLRETNSNNDRVNYLVSDNTLSFSQGSLNMRPRDENLFKLGMGLNFWSWYTKNARLEIDYDLTTGASYQEHLISGKVGIKF